MSKSASRSGHRSTTNYSTHYDAVVVGAGFAGLYMLYRLRKLGLKVRVFEAGGGVGGTWYWNRYPGARCDIVSMEYSYQFSDELQQDWDWSERYASQSEILKYANHVADRFVLWPDLQFDTRVNAAHFDTAGKQWQITVNDGTREQNVTARYCIMATGCLSSVNMPDIPGRDDFTGNLYHTGRWPHDGVDFRGQRVAVVGTGSSAIQSIPLIAEQARELFVLQRTANYSVPAQNQPLDNSFRNDIKARYREFRKSNRETAFGADFRYSEAAALETSEEDRRAEYEDRWNQGGLPFLGAFADLLFDQQANDTAAEFIREKIRNIVDDDEVARRLEPDSVVGCKRLCADTGYYETFNRKHVSLVDLRETPIDRIDALGIVLGNNRLDVDAIVFATGFDAMTGAVLGIDIQGRNSTPLKSAWSDGPKTYLGLATHGFPNLFFVTGPGSPSVLSNMLPSIEQHVDWIADCIDHLNQTGITAIEAAPEAQNNWVEHVNEVAGASLYPNCNSWYLGANVPDKPRVFMPYLGFWPYVQRCEEIAASGYEGFQLTR